MEASWQAPQTDLNSPMGLGQKEAENLTRLLECACLASKLLEEETLVNVGLSPAELGGNSLWTFDMVVSKCIYTLTDSAHFLFCSCRDGQVQ